MSLQRVAVIGDPHGVYEEFNLLVSKLKWIGLDEIWTTGDLVDRGADSHAVIQTCIKQGIKSVRGNHDDSIVNHWNRQVIQGGPPSKNADKRVTISQLTQEDVNYLDSLPPLHVFDDLGLILVHGGVWPKIPLYKQPINTIRAQMIHPEKLGESRWWGADSIMGKNKKTEEQNREDGFSRWYELYDYKEDIIYGHSTFAQPMVFENGIGGKSIGVDTGSCFGGSVTACIYESTGSFYFISVKSKKVYCEDTRRSFWEG